MKRPHQLKLAALLLLGGCSQIIGVSSYEIDPKLDGPSKPGGSDGGAAGDGAGGEAATGNTGNTGNTDAGGVGGEPDMPQAGEGGVGGASGAGGAGGEPPVLIPCDGAACCTKAGGTAVGVEMLSDGGFELGTTELGLTPWTETSKKGYALITDGVAEKADPKSGTYFAFLAGVTDEQSDLQSEKLTIPADAGWMLLAGYRYFQLDSAADDTMNKDFMGIGLYSYKSTDALEIPFFWDETNPGETVGYVKFQKEWDAAPHAGEDRYLMLRASTDAHHTEMGLTSSNYMIDELSLKVFRCYAP